MPSAVLDLAKPASTANDLCRPAVQGCSQDSGPDCKPPASGYFPKKMNYERVSRRTLKFLAPWRLLMKALAACMDPAGNLSFSHAGGTHSDIVAMPGAPVETCLSAGAPSR